MNADVDQLLLQKALTQSSYTEGSNRSVVILKSREEEHIIEIKVGVFFTGILPGCACSGDPDPNNEFNEYAELLLNINKQTGDTAVKLLQQ